MDFFWMHPTYADPTTKLTVSQLGRNGFMLRGLRIAMRANSGSRCSSKVQQPQRPTTILTNLHRLMSCVNDLQ